MTEQPPPGSPGDVPEEDLEHDADLDSLANERTLLAWVRTGFSLVAAGGLVLHLSEYALRSAELIAGLGMVGLGIGTWATGYFRFRTGERAIARSDPTLPIGSVRVVAVVVCASVTCALVLALLAG